MISKVNQTFLSPVFVILTVGALSLASNIYFFAGEWGAAHTIYALGLIGFVVGFFYVKILRKFVAQNLQQRVTDIQYRAPTLVIWVYWGGIVTGAAIGGWIFLIRGMLQPGPLLFNLRYSHTILELPTFGAQHFALFGLALAAYYAHSRRMWPAMLALSIFIFISLCFAQRTSMLFGFAGVFYIAVWKGAVTIKTALFAGLAFLGLTVLIAVGTNKLTSVGHFFVIPYFSYGITSFENWYLDSTITGCPGLVLGNAFQFVLNVMGFVCKAELTKIPEGQFNVATYVAPLYVFGGVLGVAVIMFVIGTFMALLHWCALKLEGYALALLAFFSYSMVMVFYAYQFALTTYIYLAALLLPLFYKRQPTIHASLAS